MERIEILDWLREEEPARRELLYRRADETRRCSVGDEVHLRGLLEISNYCVRSCAYCGLNAGHSALTRYRMSAAEIMECVQDILAFGYGTVVMQSGEDYGIEAGWMADVVRRIKSETPLAVTLSLGERPEGELIAWKRAGADRYLLRFETSDAALYDRIHPPLAGRVSDRIAMLKRLRQIGYEIGSGVMIGIPGQTFESLANDLELFRALDLDMIGVGPYLPHPATPLGKMETRKAPEQMGSAEKMGTEEMGTEKMRIEKMGAEQMATEEMGSGSFSRPSGKRCLTPFPPPAGTQVPNSEEMTYKVVALARLLCPQANIPATTALATLNTAQGRELGLSRGANVVMPNVTPAVYRRLYEIYPGKACISETAAACHGCMAGRIRAIGRSVGVGPGARKKMRD